MAAEDSLFLAGIAVIILYAIVTSPPVPAIELDVNQTNITAQPVIQSKMTTDQFVENLVNIPSAIPFIKNFDPMLGWVILIVLFFVVKGFLPKRRR